MDIEVRPKKVKPKARRVRLNFATPYRGHVIPVEVLGWRVECDKVHAEGRSFASAYGRWSHRRELADRAGL